MPTSAPSGHLLPWEGDGRPLHRLLIQMAFDTRMPLPRIRHFERKREIFFVRGKAKDVRGTASGKHRTPCAPEERCFMQTDSRMKQKMANEKNLGCARDDATRILLPSKAMRNNNHLIFAFHLPRGTCSSHRSDRETLSQLSFIP